MHHLFGRYYEAISPILSSHFKNAPCVLSTLVSVMTSLAFQLSNEGSITHAWNLFLRPVPRPILSFHSLRNILLVNSIICALVLTGLSLLYPKLGVSSVRPSVRPSVYCDFLSVMTEVFHRYSLWRDVLAVPSLSKRGVIICISRTSPL